jgi:hypothetical protein
MATARKAAAALKDQTDQTSQLQKQVESLKKKNEHQNKDLEAAAKRLRSVAMPSCLETGAAGDWLFTAIIRSRDSYEVDGKIDSLRQVLDTYGAALDSARSKGCKQSIQVYIGADAAGIEYDFALRRIEEYFYTKKLGPRK